MLGIPVDLVILVDDDLRDLNDVLEEKVIAPVADQGLVQAARIRNHLAPVKKRNIFIVP